MLFFRKNACNTSPFHFPLVEDDLYKAAWSWERFLSDTYVEQLDMYNVCMMWIKPGTPLTSVVVWASCHIGHRDFWVPITCQALGLVNLFIPLGNISLFYTSKCINTLHCKGLNYGTKHNKKRKTSLLLWFPNSNPFHKWNKRRHFTALCLHISTQKHVHKIVFLHKWDYPVCHIRHLPT